MTHDDSRRKRMGEFMPLGDRKSVLVRADRIAGSANLGQELTRILPSLLSSGADGLVISAASTREQEVSLRGRISLGLLVSSDWASQHCGELEVGSRTNGKAVLCSPARLALSLGTSGAVSYFLVGHQKDEDEARNFAFVSKLIDDCYELDLPSLIGAVPIGDRPTKETYVNCVGLAARMASEAGASCVAVPYTGSDETLQRTVDVMGVPTYLLELDEKMSRGQPDHEFEDLLSAAVNTDVCGIILSALTGSGITEKVKRAIGELHGGSNLEKRKGAKAE